MSGIDRVGGSLFQTNGWMPAASVVVVISARCSRSRKSGTSTADIWPRPG